jgi:hypothetical protein
MNEKQNELSNGNERKRKFVLFLSFETKKKIQVQQTPSFPWIDRCMKVIIYREKCTVLLQD